MVNSYYAVIVGTQPGVYRDWTQAAPKVSEISGAIHKKFKTHAEAWDAFNMAEREGVVRAVRVGPDAEAAVIPAPLSRISLPRDSRQRPSPREPRLSQEAPGERAVAQPAGLVTRLGGHSRGNRSGSGSIPMLMTREGPTSRNVSLQHPTHRIGPVAVGADSRGRSTSASRENLNQGSRSVRAYLDGAGRSSPLSSRLGDRIQVFMPAGPSSIESTNVRWQDDQNEGAVTLPSPDRATVRHGNARAASTSRETRQTFREDTAVLRLSQPAPLISRSPRDEDYPGILPNLARTPGPLNILPAADGRANIGLEAHARRDILNPVASPGVQNWGDNSEERRAGVQSLDQDGSPYAFDLQLRTRTGVGDSLRVPALSRPPSACSHISVSSTETFSHGSVISFDADLSVQMEPSGSELHRRSEAADAPRSAPSPAPSEFSFTIAGLVEGIGPGPSAQSQEDLNEDDSERNAPWTILWPHAPDNSRLFGTLRASPLRSPQADLSYPRGDSPPPRRPLSPFASTSRTPTHLRTQDIRHSLVDIAASSPRRAPSPWSPSLQSATGSGLSLRGDAISSPRHRPLPQSPAAQAPGGSPANYRRAGRTGAQSPTGDQTYPRNAIPQDQAPPLRLSPADRDRMHGIVGMALMDGVEPSPSRIPLPLSPAPSTRSSARSLAQPSHRHRPEMPLYPFLANGDGAPLSPSGLDIDMELPTRALSPIQVPAVIRSPSMDPRSPFSPRTWIPSNFMELLNIFFGRPTPPRNSDVRTFS